MTVVAGAHLQAVKNAILIAHSIDLVSGSPWKGPAIKHWALNEQEEKKESGEVMRESEALGPTRSAGIFSRNSQTSANSEFPTGVRATGPLPLS